MLKNSKGSSILGDIYILMIYMFLLVGWIRNIVLFTQSDFKDPYKNEIIRGIGIPCAPLGMVCGYISIDDTPSKK